MLKITSGVLKVKVCKITTEGVNTTYSAPIEVADIVSFSTETAESQTPLTAGDRTLLSITGIGKTTGSIEVFSVTEEAEKLIFDVRKNANGGKLLSVKANCPNLCLIIEQHVTNENNEDSIESLVFPKVAMSKVQPRQGSTRGESGEINASTKSLAFTAMALDTGIYCAIEEGEVTEVTSAMFVEQA